jgi:hypothetical protein
MKSFLRRTRPCSMAIVAALLPFAARAALAAPPSRACELPQSLQREIAKKYPGSSVVGLQDLTNDDLKFFKHDHGSACPGLAKVDFYGDGKPTLAVVLVVKSGAKSHTQFVLAHEVETAWNIRTLDTGGPSRYAPVVWSQPPGKYRDVENGKVIRASRPVIVFCGYEGWAIVYSWTGNKVDKVWISD